MAPTKHEPLALSPHFFQLGTPAFPVYLSLGAAGMLIEGGTGPTFPIVLEQLAALGVAPERIEYVFLTHTHPDHVGAVPHLKRRWPHLKVLGSPEASRILNSGEYLKQFLLVDLGIAQLLKAKGEIAQSPGPLENYRVEVDLLVRAGDRIELGDGIVWRVLDAPGHSACQVALYEEQEGTLALGDAAGFYVPDKGAFWPNYFQSLPSYCDSLRRLALLPARRAALSHNGVVQTDVRTFLERALQATAAYHADIVRRLRRGEGVEEIALEKARVVDSLTDIQPFRVMYDCCRLMIGLSQSSADTVSFDLAGQGAPAVAANPRQRTAPASEAPPDVAAPLRLPSAGKRLTPGERLRLIELIDDGMRRGAANSPMTADLFNELWVLVDATVKGSRIQRSGPGELSRGFQTVEINAADGENLGRLNMLYLKKPLPCYYLVYVEVAAPYRKKGLGSQILKYFGEFLVGKSALGILDNIIPPEDPSYDIYRRQAWRPVEEILGGAGLETDDNFMLFVPPGLAARDLKQPVLKVVTHLRRRRAVIEARDNEAMVQRTLGEFRALYDTLRVYFGRELETRQSSLFMRFMLTRFVTKFIAFRRRISTLIGYTGGDSTEQIVLEPAVANLQIKSYPPQGLVTENATGTGDLAVLYRLPEDMRRQPARAIEALPNYRRPSLMAWLRSRGKSYGDSLTLGDLLDLGFDPTRLKELDLEGEVYIFERVQVRRLPELERRQALLARIAAEMPHCKVRGAWLRTNPVLLVIRDRGNGYALRRRIDAIHWDEALEQMESDPGLKALNQAVKVGRVLTGTVREALKTIASELQVEEERVFGQLTPFVAWDLANNQPRLNIDFAMTCLETVWLA